MGLSHSVEAAAASEGAPEIPTAVRFRLKLFKFSDHAL